MRHRFGRGGLLVSLFVLGLGSRLLSSELPPLPVIPFEEFEEELAGEVEKAYQKVQATPEDAEANGQLGMILHAQRQYSLAAACYKRAHYLQPREVRWIYFLGMTQSEIGESEGALDSLSKAVELNPDYLPARVRLAEAYLGAGFPDRSLQLLEDLLEVVPESARVHYDLGRSRQAKKDLEGAAANFERACELFPDYGAAHYSLALVYRNLGRREDAAKHLGLYRENQNTVPPENDSLYNVVLAFQIGARHYLERGLRSQELGDTDKAISNYKKALEADADYVDAHINLLSVYVTLGNPEEAENHFRAAIEINPNSAEAYYNYGILLSRQDRATEAQESFEKALEINPYYSEAHNNLGFYSFTQGRLDQAEQHFRQALQSRPGYREARYNLARTLLKQGKPVESIPELEKLVSAGDPESPQILYTLADVCASAGMFERALSYAEKAVEQATALGQNEFAAKVQAELESARREMKKNK